MLPNFVSAIPQTGTSTTLSGCTVCRGVLYGPTKSQEPARPILCEETRRQSLTFLPLPLCPLLLPPRTLAGPPSSDIHLYFANITTGLPSEDGITVYFQFE